MRIELQTVSDSPPQHVRTHTSFSRHTQSLSHEDYDMKSPRRETQAPACTRKRTLKHTRHVGLADR